MASPVDSRNSLPVVLKSRIWVVGVIVRWGCTSLLIAVVESAFTRESSNWSRFGPSFPPTVANVMSLAPFGRVTDKSFVS